jgi:hypothetical protein
MPHFPDLSAYSYDNRSTGLLNVGWLDGEHSYHKGPVASELVDRLREYCVAKTTAQMRGFHVCNLCHERVYQRYAEWCGQRRMLGSAEIRVTGASGQVYAAPDLIIHYVEQHEYRPPNEFLSALERHLDGQTS